MVVGVCWRIIAFQVVLMTSSVMAQLNCALTVKNAMDDYKQCVDYTYRTLFSVTYGLSSNVQQSCAANNLFQCKDGAEKKIGGCLDYGQRQSMEYTFQAMDAGYNYWCANQANNLIEFYNRRGPDCYFQRQTMLQKCEMDVALTNIRIQEYNQDYCRSLDMVMTCLQQVYERCLSRENPDLIRGFYNAIWQATLCPRNIGVPLGLRGDATSSTYKMSVVLASMGFILVAKIIWL